LPSFAFTYIFWNSTILKLYRWGFICFNSIILFDCVYYSAIWLHSKR